MLEMTNSSLPTDAIVSPSPATDMALNPPFRVDTFKPWGFAACPNQTSEPPRFGIEHRIWLESFPRGDSVKARTATFVVRLSPPAFESQAGVRSTPPVFKFHLERDFPSP